MPIAPSEQGIAFQWGAAALLVAMAVILAALGFQYIGGYIPCPLCLQQRYAYYAGIPLLFLALVLLRAGRPGIATLLFLAVAPLFLLGAGLAVYQAGAEWKLWPGPETCATAQPLSSSASNLLKDLATTQLVRCDEANWRLLGLSFAGWNAVTSALIVACALQAAVASRRRCR